MDCFHSRECLSFITEVIILCIRFTTTKFINMLYPQVLINGTEVICFFALHKYVLLNKVST